MIRVLILVVLALTLFSAEDRAADHAALRTLMDSAAAALESRDPQRIAPLLAERFILVTEDQTVHGNVEDLRRSLERWYGGANPVLRSVKLSASVDRPAEFLTERSAVASGTVLEHYVLGDGQTVEVPARWSATLLRQDDGWRIASLHIGVNYLDNPLLSAAVSRCRLLVGVALGTLLAGLLVGWLVGRRRRAA